ncbi:DsrE family protein [Desulfopila inferna]|uniref:DsrE family protein n=1 Tax=Desulfopila inferna TaxID=468528 RepID=UPI001962FB18|nr:DsrE family protein [Desulfopila inferna]MBM9605899.1 DsrE family protein [Desulfopila inferna]
MRKKDNLYILWTSDSKITAEKMVFMYSINAMRQGWWKKVTIIIWGAPALLVSEDVKLFEKVAEAQQEGVHISACKACADQLGVTEKLEKLGVEVIYWGEPLTEILQNDEKLITI